MTLQSAHGQADLLIYTDKLVNGFQNWSWAANNTANASPVHSGSNAVSVSANYGEAFSAYHPDFDATVYSNLVFWAHGGPGGGQVLQIYAEYDGGFGPTVPLSALPANNWQQFVVSLADLGVAGQTNLTRFNFQLIGGTADTFYLDDIKLTARPAPSLIHLGVHAAQPIRTVDRRWFGANSAIWDNNFNTVFTPILLTNMGCLTLRYPGGSRSDDYHWYNNRSVTDNLTWATPFSSFVHVATNIGAQVFITANYGTGTPSEAADWVRSANVTNHLGFKYWEIGNEIYGSWEVDSNSLPHDPYTYALRATNYIQQMKAVDPTIKIGVVVVTGEDNFANYTTHPAINPLTGLVHNGWTPVLLATLSNAGVTPDFVIYHSYPQYGGGESDPLLLQSAQSWPADAADLRQQLIDYLGPANTNVELVCTENNSIAGGGLGKQTVSLVNALYLADSFCHLAQTEFNALVWWDIRNGVDTTGNYDPSLYGWRTNASGQFYGDFGLMVGATGVYPPYYAFKLLQFLARPGDTVLSAQSDYILLSTYAVRRTNGSLAVLVINKDPGATFNAQVALDGFVPYSNATLRSYGIPQDNAAHTGVGSQDIATTSFSPAATNFNYAFPPYSLTLFSFSPAAPQLAVLPSPSGQLVLQLQGQPNVPYVLQTSTSLTGWTSVQTNASVSGTQLFTNVIPPIAAQQFWRAVWQP